MTSHGGGGSGTAGAAAAAAAGPCHLLALGAEGIIQERPASLAASQCSPPRPPQSHTEVHGSLRQRRRAGRQEEEQRGRAGAGAGPAVGWKESSAEVEQYWR